MNLYQNEYHMRVYEQYIVHIMEESLGKFNLKIYLSILFLMCLLAHYYNFLNKFFWKWLQIFKVNRSS